VQGLRVLLLGQGRLELDGQALTRLLAPKQQALLFYLAAVGGSVARTKLASMLWSELDEASARSNLRGALSRLRRWLPELLLVDAQQIGLAPGAAWEVDEHWTLRAGYSRNRGQIDSSRTVQNLLVPSIHEEAYTAGLSWRIDSHSELNLGYELNPHTTLEGTGPSAGTSLTSKVQMYLLGFHYTF